MVGGPDVGSDLRQNLLNRPFVHVWGGGVWTSSTQSGVLEYWWRWCREGAHFKCGHCRVVTNHVDFPALVKRLPAWPFHSWQLLALAGISVSPAADPYKGLGNASSPMCNHLDFSSSTLQWTFLPEITLSVIIDMSLCVTLKLTLINGCWFLSGLPILSAASVIISNFCLVPASALMCLVSQFYWLVCKAVFPSCSGNSSPPLPSIQISLLVLFSGVSETLGLLKFKANYLCCRFQSAFFICLLILMEFFNKRIQGLFFFLAVEGPLRTWLQALSVAEEVLRIFIWLRGVGQRDE